MMHFCRLFAAYHIDRHKGILPMARHINGDLEYLQPLTCVWESSLSRLFLITQNEVAATYRPSDFFGHFLLLEVEEHGARRQILSERPMYIGMFDGYARAKMKGDEKLCVVGSSVVHAGLTLPKHALAKALVITGNSIDVNDRTAVLEFAKKQWLLNR